MIQTTPALLPSLFLPILLAFLGSGILGAGCVTARLTPDPPVLAAPTAGVLGRHGDHVTMDRMAVDVDGLPAPGLATEVDLIGFGTEGAAVLDVLTIGSAPQFEGCQLVELKADGVAVEVSEVGYHPGADGVSDHVLFVLDSEGLATLNAATLVEIRVCGAYVALDQAQARTLRMFASAVLAAAREPSLTL